MAWAPPGLPRRETLVSLQLCIGEWRWTLHLPCFCETPTHPLKFLSSHLREAGGSQYHPVRTGRWVSQPREKGSRNALLEIWKKAVPILLSGDQGSVTETHRCLHCGADLETGWGLALLYVLWPLGPARPREGNSLPALQLRSFLKNLDIGFLSIRLAWHSFSQLMALTFCWVRMSRPSSKDVA